MAAPTVPDPARTIQGLLQAASSLSGATISVGKMPSEPHAAICVYNTGGRQPDPKFLLDYPSVQVLVRGPRNNYDTAWATAISCKNALLGLNSQTIGDDRWVAINMIGDINNLGVDEQDRCCFSINFSCIVEPGPDLTSNRVPL